MLNVPFAFPQSVYQLLPPPYRDVWLEWLDSEKAVARDKQDKKDKVIAILLSLNVESGYWTFFSSHLYGTFLSISMWNILLSTSLCFADPLTISVPNPGVTVWVYRWIEFVNWSVNNLSSSEDCSTDYCQPVWKRLWLSNYTHYKHSIAIH